MPSWARVGSSSAVRRERWWLHLLLLVLTFGTMTMIGAIFAAGYDRRLVIPDPADRLIGLFPHLALHGIVITPELLIAGLSYSIPLLSILLAHEMGHYLSCKRYGIDASPPFFLPFLPIVPLPGTLGAFIRVREPIRDKKALFDMAVAGPISGFLVAVPFAYWGILHTRVTYDPPTLGTYYFGYPIVMTLLQFLTPGGTFTSFQVVEHPTLMAAWWGFVVTAINLIPAGQLDGGHTLYAVFGSRQRLFRWPVLLILFALGFMYVGWWVWAGIAFILTALGHPRVFDENLPLDPIRKLVAVLTFAILVLTFVTVPVRELRDLPPLRAPRERGGTVVHQLDLHRGSEGAGRHGDARGAQDGHVAVEERPGLLRAGRPFEAGPPPA